MSSNDWDRSEQMECVLIEIVNVQARWSRFLILTIGLLFSALWFFFSWFYWLNNSNSLDHHNSTYPGEVNQVAKAKQTTISSLSSIQLEIRNSIFVTAGQSLEDASWRCEILVFTQKKRNVKKYQYQLSAAMILSSLFTSISKIENRFRQNVKPLLFMFYLS